MYVISHFRSPGPGDRVPDFDLPTLGGGRFRSTDLGETGPALLVFGSYTCPVTENAAPGLKELHGRFGGQIDGPGRRTDA